MNAQTTIPASPPEFVDAVARAKQNPAYPAVEPALWALGYTREEGDTILEVLFFAPYGNVYANYGSFALLLGASYQLAPESPRYISRMLLENGILPQFAWTGEAPYDQKPHFNVAVMRQVVEATTPPVVSKQMYRPVLVTVDTFDSVPASPLAIRLLEATPITIDVYDPGWTGNSFVERTLMHSYEKALEREEKADESQAKELDTGVFTVSAMELIGLTGARFETDPETGAAKAVPISI